MEFIYPNFSDPSVWLSLLTLTFLEIVLGIDNIIFISLVSNKLKDELRQKASFIGLGLAMIFRIILLFGISWLISMNNPFWSIDLPLLKVGITGQSVILLLGGLFLLYKSVSEIHHKLEGNDDGMKTKHQYTLQNAIIQITLINIVFSFDSILTAVGMTNGIAGAMVLMIISVVASVLIMMLFAIPVGQFVNKHPTIQILGLSFLILIGFMLIIEAAHLSHLIVMESEIGAVPKGYLYFAIAFSLFVEFLNIKFRKKQETVNLHSITQKAEDSGILK